VGHETDFSIADFVADLRAPTPSAAAEIVMAAADEHLKYFGQMEKRFNQTILHLLATHRQRLDAIRKQPILTSPFAILGNAAQRLDDLSEEMLESMQRVVATKKLELQGLKRQLLALDPLVKVQHLKQKLAQLTAHLKSIDPKNLLTKGYSILFRENTGSVIFSSKDVEVGDNVRVVLQDGPIKAKIYEI
jgi:exodeoxyribonuclease VII large subunit